MDLSKAFRTIVDNVAYPIAKRFLSAERLTEIRLWLKDEFWQDADMVKWLHRDQDDIDHYQMILESIAMRAVKWANTATDFEKIEEVMKTDSAINKQWSYDPDRSVPIKKQKPSFQEIIEYIKANKEELEQDPYCNLPSYTALSATNLENAL